MQWKSSVPQEFLANLGYMPDAMSGRLLEMIVGLGGEVFVLKAELRRMRMALEAIGQLGEQALENASASAEFKAWLQQEQQAFGLHLMDPIARGKEISKPGREDN